MHFFGLVVDLCDLRGVRRVARDLVDGQVPLGAGVDGEGEGYVIPRLDVVCMNAGIGGWSGMNWVRAVTTVLTDLVHATTYPDFKIADIGRRVKLQSAFGKGKGEQQALLDGEGEKVEDADEPVLGEVFTANVFGHYMLGHWLMPLLCRSPQPVASDSHSTTSSSFDPSEPSSTSNSNVHTPTSSHSSDFALPASKQHEVSGDESSKDRSRGRIIWASSVEAIADAFSLDDIQGLQSAIPYEASKRLTDILALTADLPSVQKYSQSYFQVGEKSKALASESAELVPPTLYLTHPGICGTEIVPLPWILVQAMNLAFYLARWLGSVWHCILPYTGACSMVWVALMTDGVLESIREEGNGKWGSSTDWWGNVRVKRTEVEGWGWSGHVEEDFGKDKDHRRGRRRGVRDSKEEDRVEFEVLGAQVWKEMECMRREWEKRLGEE